MSIYVLVKGRDLLVCVDLGVCQTINFRKCGCSLCGPGYLPDNPFLVNVAVKVFTDDTVSKPKSMKKVYSSDLKNVLWGKDSIHF